MQRDFKRYRIKGDRGQGIAVIAMDGYFSIISDHGNFAFGWFAHGMDDFRKFLVKLESDYLLSKLVGQPTYFDPVQTKALVKEHIDNLRDGGDPTDLAKYRKEIALWKATDFDDPNSREEWHRKTKLRDAWEMSVTDYTVNQRHFYANVYVPFVAMLREELENEAHLAAQPALGDQPGLVDGIPEPAQ